MASARNRTIYQARLGASCSFKWLAAQPLKSKPGGASMTSACRVVDGGGSKGGGYWGTLGSFGAY